MRTNTLVWRGGAIRAPFCIEVTVDIEDR